MQKGSKDNVFRTFYKMLAVRTRLELVTPCVTGMYSNQLN